MRAQSNEMGYKDTDYVVIDPDGAVVESNGNWLPLLLWHINNPKGPNLRAPGWEEDIFNEHEHQPTNGKAAS